MYAHLCARLIHLSFMCVHLASLVLPLLVCFTVCFKLFDHDSDGRISWAEFVDVIACCLGIQEENKPPNEPRDSPEVDTTFGVYTCIQTELSVVCEPVRACRCTLVHAVCRLHWQRTSSHSLLQPNNVLRLKAEALAIDAATALNMVQVSRGAGQ